MVLPMTHQKRLEKDFLGGMNKAAVSSDGYETRQQQTHPSLSCWQRVWSELFSTGNLMMFGSTLDDSRRSPLATRPPMASEMPSLGSEYAEEISPPANSVESDIPGTSQSMEGETISGKASPEILPGRRARTWPQKFRDAFRGVGLGVRGQNSFLVHGFFTIAALGAAAFFQISLLEWLIVGLCIVIVWTAEMFNSALERLARAVNLKYDPHIRDALDIGSGAVLLTAIGAATIGGILFLYHFLKFLGVV